MSNTIVVESVGLSQGLVGRQAHYFKRLKPAFLRELFQRGYNKLNYPALLAELDLSLSRVGAYYPNKESVLAALLYEVEQQFVGHFIHQPTFLYHPVPEKRREAFFDQFQRFIQCNPEGLILSLVGDECCQGALKAHFVQLLQQWRIVFQQILESFYTKTEATRLAAHSLLLLQIHCQFMSGTRMMHREGLKRVAGMLCSYWQSHYSCGVLSSELNSGGRQQDD